VTKTAASGITVLVCIFIIYQKIDKLKNLNVYNKTTCILHSLHSVVGIPFSTAVKVVEIFTPT